MCGPLLLLLSLVSPFVLSSNSCFNPEPQDSLFAEEDSSRSQLLSSSSSNDSINEGRVVHGKLSKRGRWPFVVSLLYKRRHFCGGSLLNDNSVLTASHCAFKPNGTRLNVSKILVYVGHTDLSHLEEESLYPVKAFLVNDAFAKGWSTAKGRFNFKAGSDVAVIKLSKRIHFAKMRPKVSKVCLPTREVRADGRRCLVMGWGATRTGGPTTKQLREVTVPVLREATCSRKHNYDPAKLICAGDLRRGKDACQGDSGGPFVCPSRDNHGDYLQFGLVSYGGECGLGGLYTKVAVYLDWIKERARK